MSSKNPLQIDKQIGSRIRGFRAQRNLTQSDLAVALGVTFQQIQKYEKGTNRISGSRLVKLCAVLGVSPQQVLGDHNADGVDTLGPILKDHDMMRMLVEIAKLPVVRRKAVTSSMVMLARAFGGTR